MSTLAHTPDLAITHPALENQSANAWHQHAQLAYLFARHARHDLANVHCALGMLEMVEQIQTHTPQAQLPPELQPDQIRKKARQDLRQVISMSNDLVLLSQAGSQVGYRPAQALNLADLFVQCVLEPLGSEHPTPSDLLGEAAEAQVLSFGDMLGAAINAFYCQWSAGEHPHIQAAQAVACISVDRVILRIPADEVTLTTSFGKHLAESTPEVAIEKLLSHALTTTTGELALWMARHILIIHGGNVCVDLAASHPAFQLVLPRTSPA